MAFWIRLGPCAVNTEDGLIRAADFAQLTSVAQMAAAVEQQTVKLLAQAQEQAQQLLSQAQQQADEQLRQAAERETKGYDDGLARGQEEAIAKWTERAVEDARTSQDALQRQRERLGNIVTTAVERIIGEEDRQALYGRALRTISKLVGDVPMLTLRVPVQAKDAAVQALNSLTEQISLDVPVEVVGDAQLAEGSCMFESDRGVIDVGLQTQLSAIKRAVVRAAQAALDEPASAEPSSEPTTEQVTEKE
jgi:type III secretion protein L